MTTELNFARDAQSAETFAPDFSDEMYSVAIAASTEQTQTIPGSGLRYIAIFTYEPGAEVWVAKNNTATVPAGATFAATNSSMNPVARKVYSGDIIHFITADDSTSIGIELYVI